MKVFFLYIKNSLKDLLPIIFVIVFFQIIILQQPIPNFYSILLGSVFVLIGLAMFVYGLEIALFPIGEMLAFSLAKKGSVFWLLLFSFALGFGTTIAEPALITIVNKAAEIAKMNNIISPDGADNYATGLRYTIALSVGIAVMIGVVRIIKNWPIQWVIIGGYLSVILITIVAPKSIIGIAYDSGSITTSTITVPLVTALGVGLATSIKGRNPLVDGFGLIALASLLPISFVMIYGIITT